MNNDITPIRLKDIFESDSYKIELTAVSSYAANTKQEKHLIDILAKLLDEKGFTIILEYKNKGKKNDLKVGDAIIEAKFFYESDLSEKLKHELERYNNNIKKLIEFLNNCIESKKKISWSISLPILKDIFKKEPDFFIVIIQSRDLRYLDNPKEKLKIIGWSDEELKYNKKFGFNNGNTLKILLDFLDKIKEEKPFTIDHVMIDIKNKLFPSTYHIYICDFNI